MQPVWWYTAADYWIAPVWPHLVHQLRSSTSGATKKRFHVSGAPPPDRAPQTKTHPAKTATPRGCRGTQNHSGTQSSHLKSTDSESGGEQERLKMWHRALCVRLSKQRRDVSHKERSPMRRSYLIRHTSFPLLPTRIQVNYLDLDRFCSSARKWLFSAPSEDCPFWITWYYFVASFTGHRGDPRSLCRPCSLSTLSFIPGGPRSAFYFFYFTFVWLIYLSKLHRSRRCHASRLSETDCKWFGLHYWEALQASGPGPSFRLAHSDVKCN